MHDNLFSAILTFSLLVGGTIAVGAEMVGGHRSAAVADAMTLPKMTVIGHRDARVAVETHQPAPRIE